MFGILKRLLDEALEIRSMERSGKKWYRSKTIWANALGILIISIHQFGGIDLGISTQDQAQILAVINIVLRFFTHESTGFYYIEDDKK